MDKASNEYYAAPFDGMPSVRERARRKLAENAVCKKRAHPKAWTLASWAIVALTREARRLTAAAAQVARHTLADKRYPGNVLEICGVA